MRHQAGPAQLSRTGPVPETSAPCGQLPAPDLIRSLVECSNALLAFDRYCRHKVRFTDPAQDSIHQELATDVAGTDLDLVLALSVALTHLGDEVGAERGRRGFIERQDEQTLLEEKASLP